MRVKVMQNQDANYHFIQELNAKLGRTLFIGRSEVLIKELKKLVAIARTDETVLILGETGSGKGVCALAIHLLSRRAAKPFHALNCGLFTTERLESELFGHTKGAFTGAAEAVIGAVQAAEGGSLFLDEINSVPLAVQPKLLYFLDEGTFAVVGHPKIHKANVRMIAASNEDLSEKVRAKEFRQDMRARLNNITITMPPLRERPEDIPLLAAHFLAHSMASQGRRGMKLSPGALEKLIRFDWPDNLRQLKSVMASAVACGEGPIIDASDVVLSGPAEPTPPGFNEAKAKAIAKWEERETKKRLAAANGNISKAARDGGQDPRVLRALMRKHQIATPGYGRLPGQIPRRSQVSSPRPEPSC